MMVVTRPWTAFHFADISDMLQLNLKYCQLLLQIWMMLGPAEVFNYQIYPTWYILSYMLL